MLSAKTTASSTAGKTVFVAVMGMTGSGKSTFIQHCTKQKVEIGNSLHACTQTVNVYTCDLISGIDIKLVDTPGFDDTNRTDTEILREIATWLAATYSQRIKLKGIIYLHSIAERRMTGSASKNLIMFKKLCGPDALRHVILVTTMWDTVDDATGREREKELARVKEFWGSMLQRGSRMERHENSQSSAKRLVSMFAAPKANAQEFTLDLQKQMVDEGKTLDKTAAGLVIEGQLAEQKKKFEKELEREKKNMKDALKKKDKEMEELALEEQKRIEAKVAQVAQEQVALKRSMQQELNRKINEMETLFLAREAESKAQLDEEREKRRLADEEHKRQMQSLQKKLSAQLALSKIGLKRTTSSTSTQPSASSSQSPVVKRTASAKTKVTTPVSEPYESLVPQNDDILSISNMSLVGEHYALSGDYQSLWKHPQLDSVISNPAPSSSPPGNPPGPYIILGKNGSFVVQYTRVNKLVVCERSDILLREYGAKLDSFVRKHGRAKDFFLSLGCNGTFFARCADKLLWNVDSATATHVGSPELLQKMWFGKSNAYVALKAEGTWCWDLKGQYVGLSNALKKGDRSPPMAIAMNLENGEEYVAIGTKGWYWYNTQGKSVASITLVNWLRRHGFNTKESS